MLHAARPKSPAFASLKASGLDFGISLLILLPILGLLIAIDAVGGDISVALKDPATQTGSPVYLGAVSNAGAVIMIAAASATLMAVAVETDDRVVFAGVGLMTGAMALDDLFLLHEGPIRDVLPWFELVMFGFYGMSAAVIVWLRRRFLVQPRHIALSLSIACLGVSVVLDLFDIAGVPYAAEDLSKLAGFVLWSVYWTRCAFAAIRAGSAA